jgi:hypothetical protein
MSIIINTPYSDSEVSGILNSRANHNNKQIESKNNVESLELILNYNKDS